MAAFFIRRPIVAIVIAIVTVIGGIVSLRTLPVAQFPDIVPPQIIVAGTFTGADALTIEQSVATPLEQQLHRDHAALAALLVPPPTAVEIGHIRSILEVHNELEEKSGGLYEIVEELSGDELSALMARVHAIPEVPVLPNVDTPVVRSSIETLLRERLKG